MMLFAGLYRINEVCEVFQVSAARVSIENDRRMCFKG